MRYLKWFQTGSSPVDRPRVKNVEGFHMDADGCFYRIEGPIMIEIHKKKKYAGGSGWQWAIAAMDHGKSAAEAVRYAGTRDHSTNTRVQSYNFKTKRLIIE